MRERARMKRNSSLAEVFPDCYNRPRTARDLFHDKEHPESCRRDVFDILHIHTDACDSALSGSFLVKRKQSRRGDRIKAAFLAKKGGLTDIGDMDLIFCCHNPEYIV